MPPSLTRRRFIGITGLAAAEIGLGRVLAATGGAAASECARSRIRHSRGYLSEHCVGEAFLAAGRPSRVVLFQPAIGNAPMEDGKRFRLKRPKFPEIPQFHCD